MKTTYEAKGLVIGKCWGGSECGYASRKLTAPTKKAVMKQAEEGVANGSLDSGMGFERLQGAILEVTKITTTKIKGKEFVNEETEINVIGELTEKQFEHYVNYL